MIKGRAQKHFLNFGICYEKISTEKKSNSASSSKNILIDFKAKNFPVILPTNVFQEFLSGLESTVGNKLN